MNLSSKALVAITLLCVSSLLTAQTVTEKYNPKKFKKEPVWIAMMNDPEANYYTTIKAFRDFWKSRVLPQEPMEGMAQETFEKEVGLVKEGESEKERERERKHASAKKLEESNRYAAEVRAFKGWMQDVKPWLRHDGTIIQPAERQQIIDRQAQELREIEKRNGK